MDTEEQAINDHFTIIESLTLVLSQVGIEEISDRNAKTKSEKEAKKKDMSVSQARNRRKIGKAFGVASTAEGAVFVFLCICGLDTYRSLKF